MLTKEEKKMEWKEVYIDQDQCNKFGLKYYMANSNTICADVLLDSKGGDGYDDIHKSILEPLGTSYLFLTRQADDRPGWFKIGDVLRTW